MASYMVKDHSDSERGNPLPPHGLLFPIISQVRMYVHLIADHVTTPGSYTDKNPGVGGRGALRFINKDEYV